MFPWCFDIAYLPGKTNLAADAVSRKPTQSCESVVEDNTAEFLAMGAKPLSLNPSPNGSLSEGDCAEIALLRNNNECTVLKWSDITSECTLDQAASTLATAVKQGFPPTLRECDDALYPY